VKRLAGALLPLLAPMLASAAIWPDAIGPFHRTSAAQPVISDRALWDEFGLKESEKAAYSDGTTNFSAIAYRLQDSTGALAAFDLLLPPDGKPLSDADRAVQTMSGLLLLRGNYVLAFDGYKPAPDQLKPVLDALLNVDTTPLPTLLGFFPTEGLVPNSERYIVGPNSLAKFDPGIPPSVAAFHLGAEAQLGVFHSPKGNLTLALFNYPTPQVAMQKAADFEKLPAAVAKRAGPLVAVILSPPDPDAAERLLAQVRYEAQITLHERTPTNIRQVGSMIINIFILIGILLVFCLIAGLFVGGFRVFLLRGKRGESQEPMILLHLEER